MSTTTSHIQELVHQALARFDRLAESSDPPTQVLAEMLETLVRATASQGGVVWMPAPSSDGAKPAAAQSPGFRLIAQSGQGTLGVDENQSPIPQALPIIASTIAQRKPVVVSPDAPEFRGTELGASAQFFVPIDAVGRAFGVIQIIAADDVDPKVLRQYVAFIQQGARAAGNYMARRQTQVLTDHATTHANLLNITHKLLRIDRPHDLAHELATQSRILLGAQRVAVVSFRKRRNAVLFSDTIDPNRRAVLVRAVEMLAELVRERQTPMTFVRDTPVGEEDAPIEPLLQQLYDLGAAKAVTLTPLREDDAIVGVMIAEHADAEAAGRQSGAQQDLSRQVGPILAQAERTYARPLRRTSNAIAWVRERPMTAAVRTLITLAIVAGLVYVLCFMPVDIVVRGNARLEPARMAQITAPLDGRVKTVHAATGQAVTEGQILFELDDNELRLQLAENGKLIEEQMTIARDAAAQNVTGSAGADATRAAAEFRIEGLQFERDRILQRIEDCKVRSPINGVLLTEKPNEKADMTVQKGTVMLVVADLSHFDLVAELKEEDLALVDAALSEGRSVEANFLSRAWPDKPQQTFIDNAQALAPTSVPDEYQQQHVFRVTTPLELKGISEQLALANPSGRAKFVTGRGSIAYRFGRGIWRFIQMTLLF